MVQEEPKRREAPILQESAGASVGATVGASVAGASVGATVGASVDEDEPQVGVIKATVGVASPAMMNPAPLYTYSLSNIIYILKINFIFIEY